MKSWKVRTSKGKVIAQQHPIHENSVLFDNITTYNEEAGSHEHSFHLHVHVQWELDAEVVRVGEDLFQEAAPLLADATDGLASIFPLQLRHKKNSDTEQPLNCGA